MHLSLNGAWSLSYHREEPDMPPVSAWPRIEAIVPGNVELDLFRNGKEPDPYYAENEYLFRKYEYCAWNFEKTVLVGSEFENKEAVLVFEGLNCIADIYVNDIPVGHTENALIPHEIRVTNALKPNSENTFRVYIHSAFLHARKQDFPVSLVGNEGTAEYTVLRMPPHSFGWDIMPRFLSAGMWRGVTLKTEEPARFTQVYYATTSADEKQANVVFRYRFETDDIEIDGYSVRVYMNDSLVYDAPAAFTAGSGGFTLKNPSLWWPKGYGEANLYKARMELLRNGEAIACDETTIGVRHAEVISKMAPDDEGEFIIRINGVKILAKGSNWVPMDAFHSRDAERYEKAVALFNEAGCNIVRMWGGNTYEDHALFDLFDASGIMVWHDFSYGCAIYRQDSAFLDLAYREAVTVIRRLRNHPSIILWAGDNECDDAYNWYNYTPGGNHYNALTREALPRAVRENDPYRIFLPSSPYIDNGVDRLLVPEQHNWGPRAYFKDDFYRLTRAHFVSECGYHGCPSPESLRKFIPEEELWPMSDRAWKTHNSEYRLLIKRGYDRNELMAKQVKIMCGEMPETLEEFALISQFTQAEAKKYFIESTRIHKWRRTGIIWWNMIDGWPQISDAVVDWYYVKKRAFDAIRRVQTPICIMLEEHNAWGHKVILGNDSRSSKEVVYRIIDADTNETLLEGSAVSEANENTVLGEITLLPGVRKLLLIEWFIDGERRTNHTLTGQPSYAKDDLIRWAKKIDEFCD